MATTEVNRLQHAINHCVEISTERESEPRKRGFVYVIKCDDFVKIGIASDVQSRLANLQCGNPHELTLLLHWPSPNALAAEQRLHYKLWRWHHRGEWFRFTPKVANILAAVF